MLNLNLLADLLRKLCCFAVVCSQKKSCVFFYSTSLSTMPMAIVLPSSRKVNRPSCG